MGLFPPETGLGMCYKAVALLPFLQAALTRRVDIGLIGDSNVVKDQNSGHNCGFRLAWADRFGMYSTGFIGIAGAEGIETGSNPASPRACFKYGANTGAPAALEAYNPSDNPYLPPNDSDANALPYANAFLYVPAGTVVTGQQYYPSPLGGINGAPPSPTNPNNNNGKIIAANPMDLTAALSWEFTLGTFASAAGYFNPTVHVTAGGNTKPNHHGESS